MPTEKRPAYDHATRTHYVEVPRAAYDALEEGLGMLDISLLADAATGDEWVWVECGDDAFLRQIKGIAAILAEVER
jgi:hypothetical protein